MTPIPPLSGLELRRADIRAPVDGIISAKQDFDRRDFLGVPFDMMPRQAVIDVLRSRRPDDAFQYVVTPNVDHVVRLSKRPQLMPAYRAAWMSWCDSHPICALARMASLPLPHLTGADMMMLLWDDVLRPRDRLVCITADVALNNELSERFSRYEFIGYSPPFGFEDDPAEMAVCIDFIRNNPGRFVFIGVGSPRSEQLAHAVKQAGGASGTAFCIGASLEFIVGRKPRAPRAMRAFGMEWLYRLASEPRRLWRRYLLAVLPLAGLVLRYALQGKRAAR